MRLERELASAQAELRLEAALERVRLKAMTMESSDDIGETTLALFDELKALLPDIIRSGVLVMTPPDELQSWLVGLDEDGNRILFKGMPIQRDAPGPEPGWMLDAWMEKRHLTFLESPEFLQFVVKYGYDSDPSRIIPVDAPHDQYFSQFNHKAGCLFVVAGRPIEEDSDEGRIIARFSSTYDLAYQRYMDLREAEERTREAQIEAALERVRGRAMAMQSSDEIAGIAALICEQLRRLDFPSLRRCVVSVADSDADYFWLYGSSEQGDEGIRGVKLRYDAHEHFIDAFPDRDEDLVRAVWLYEGDAMQRFIALLLDAGWKYPVGEKPAGRFYSNNSVVGNGSVAAVTYDPIEEKEYLVLDRFAHAFHLAYRRFEDLARAEAQAREAQLEAALERVRSRSMAMHHSNELMDVVTTVFRELSDLGIAREEDRVFILEFLDKQRMKAWVTTRGGAALRGSLTYDVALSSPSIGEMFSAAEKGEEWHVERFEGQDLVDRIAMDARNPGYREILADSIANKPDSPVPDGLTWTTALFAEGAVGMVTEREELDEESRRILGRFRMVFEQSYRRFADLKDAEERAVEARRQASVDRIRAEIATMRKTEDFERITPLVWKELEAQEIPFSRCGVLFVSDEDRVARFYLSRPDGSPLAALNLPYGSTEVADAIRTAWQSKKTWIEQWDRDRFISWTREMLEAGQIERPEEYYGGAAPPEAITLQFVPFEQGMMYVGSPEPLGAIQMEAVKALADAFSVAYARYDDFQRTERALQELRLTQKQLVEQEKLASLGSLTAGIAHEIKNPLNFVNNFAEVSTELVEELSEAIASGNSEEAQSILGEITENATQIAKHGKRADSIVRAMMQHARGGTSEQEMIDLNAFLEEYINLSWHGARARDHGFQVDVERRFDPAVGEVRVQPQEMGRVILNLLNNAFHALKGTESAVVTVKTRRSSAGVEITVEDNGPGIPAGIREKIFEPFFTTKATGEGTGLGLSLSYDIITKGHDGELSVGESSEGGAEFRIKLPA